ncbi:ABC transporter permease [Paenibacillus koleovorans]|uniref:ABC transporter permease n=1 Tax=Paenibacillus koleovorans TaxID=121608 RepID=UPI001FE87EBA|nr:ABC-2 family transporter protein [Paenibacillus koleovorans]
MSWSWVGKASKYTAVGRITVRSHLAYVADFAFRSLFLLLILYIFMQVWTVTFEGEGTDRIEGYTYKQIIWYLIVAESVILAFPKLVAKIETEVKNGDVGYQLLRPIHYVLYHYSAFMGEALIRFMVNLAIGSMLGIAVFGWSTPSLVSLAALAVVLLGAFTIQYAMNMMVALCAFWVEETRGLDFVYSKLLFTIGGMLLPLEMFPGALQTISGWLPFQGIAYFTAKTAVRFEAAEWIRMIGIQLIWIVVLMAGAFAVYRKGVKKLHVNGG